MNFLAALQFLTTIPVKRSFSTQLYGRATAYFPLVGLLIGLVLAALYYILSQLLPPALISALLVAALVLLTGGMHLDGLADSCDGIGGDGSPEDRWRIMHDSRSGGFGVIGVALLLLVKFAALISIPGGIMMLALITAPVISRWAMVYAIYAYSYARPSGLGKAFKETTGRRQFIMASVFAIIIAAACFRFAALPLLLGGWAISALLAAYLKNKFAGLTGDTYGAINEICETGIFILISLLAYNHWLV